MTVVVVTAAVVELTAAVLAVPVTEVLVTVAVESPMREHFGIFPKALILRTHASALPAPKEAVSPATT